ncbi:alpha-xenorhabdolysin family binary toxin subunit A [Nostoc sp. CCY 9925]|uniref:alpha-xenorhabdolysin family binary toxin subunit A n=1 Tax=Nostoc sp. CCY 9925 TaxID=3103865 RepID=UPI0039C6D3C0
MPLTVTSPAEIKALYDAGAEHVIPKEDASKELLRLATASSEFEGGRDEIGLVLDTEAILQIKRYEKRGLALPKTEGEVHTYLGGESDIPGLTNAELLATFLDIRTNAGNWSPLEYGIIQTAAQLDVFAIQVNSQGGKASDFLLEILLTYSELMDIDPDRLSDEDYMREVLESLDAEADVAKEQATKLALTKGIIDNLAKKTEEYYKETQNLLENIKTFKDELTNCSDQVKGKEELLQQLNIDEQLERKKEELDAKKARLKDLNAQYNKLVGLAFTGAPGGVIGLAITGTIFGKQAADTRKQIKEVEAEIRELEKEIDKLSRLVNVITSLDSKLVGLYTVMIQAEKGVMQLVTIWTTINELLKAASSEAAGVMTAPDVLTLWISFDAMINPWEEVGKNAAIVNKQFQDALDQWAQEN